MAEYGRVVVADPVHHQCTTGMAVVAVAAPDDMGPVRMSNGTARSGGLRHGTEMTRIVTELNRLVRIPAIEVPAEVGRSVPLGTLLSPSSDIAPGFTEMPTLVEGALSRTGVVGVEAQRMVRRA